MRLKTTGGFLVVAAVLLGTATAPVSAQTGYPPGQCTTLFSNALNVVSVAVGGTVTIPLTPTCTWTVGSSVTVTVNGQPVGLKVVQANSAVSVLVRVLSSQQLSIDNPVLVTGQCGTNTIRGVGPSAVAGGQPVVHEVTFQVLCPVPVATPAAPTPGRSGIAFTGYDAIRGVAVALLALSAGSLMVVAFRRRGVGVPVAA